MRVTIVMMNIDTKKKQQQQNLGLSLGCVYEEKKRPFEHVGNERRRDKR